MILSPIISIREGYPIDQRIERTKERIIDTFLALRRGKPFDKVTVRELCEEAKINRSTFYKYYSSTSDLALQIEQEIIDSIISVIPDLTLHLDDPVSSLKMLDGLYASKSVRLFHKLPEDWCGRLLAQIHDDLKNKLFREHPEYRDDFTVNYYISYTIYGGFYAFYKNRRFGEQELSRETAAVTEYLCRGVPHKWRPTIEWPPRRPNL